MFLGRPWIHNMQFVSSTYHQCIKFLFNSMEIIIPRDNSISIKKLIISEMLVPHNFSSYNLNPSLKVCEQKLKMMSLGMGEYTLDSIISLSVSPKSYGKASNKMKPSALAMIIFRAFV